MNSQNIVIKRITTDIISNTLHCGVVETLIDIKTKLKGISVHFNPTYCLADISP